MLDVAARLAEGTDGLVLSVAAVEGGGKEHAATFGVPDGALLPSCSSFKPVVAAAVRAAAADRALSLSEPLPDVPGGWAAPLASLLGHVSGLAGDLYEVRITAGTDEEAAAALLDRYVPAVPRTAPGRFWYSNLGYALVGLALARAEGDGLLEIVRRRILGPAGATVTTDRAGVAGPAFGDSGPPNDSLRAAGAGTYLRALDLARVGAALVAGPLAGRGLAPGEPVALLTAADQHQAGGFFVDERYGRRLLAHGGGSGAYGSAWIVDPVDGWSAAALFNHPAGYGLDLPRALTGQRAGADPLARPGPGPAAGWYLNPYGGLAEVRSGEVVAVNGRPVPARSACDAGGLVVNRTSIVIGALPYEPAEPPAADADPGLAGTWACELDELTVELGPAPIVRSARRGESPAVALTGGGLASDHGVLRCFGDDLVVGGAYRFARA
jgi:CubicO group peptidase (beta-lactamase class C family)